jgi:hypothetical protein
MNRWILTAVVAALVVPAVGVLAQQQTQPRKPPAFILGRVVDASTNQPIADATVSTGRDPARPAQPSVLTTDAGYFLFRDVTPGSYRISAVAPGYLPGGFGQRRPGGASQPFTLAEGERTANLTIRLWREATLSGTLRDESGDPIVANVSLLTSAQIAGGPTFRAALSEPQLSARTDATGAFRFTGLLPGAYIVSVPSRMTQLPVLFANPDQPTLDGFRASGLTSLTAGLSSLGPTVRLGDMLVQTSAEGTSGGSNTLTARLPITVRPDGTVLGYAATFFPDAVSPAQAEVIRLASGDDRRGVDLRLRRAALGRVSGTLIGPNGPVSGFAIHLIPAFASNSGLERTHETAVTISGADGAFTFLAAPPGEYILKAWKLPPSLVIGAEALPADSTLWASQPITIADRSLTNVTVTLKTGSSIRGRVVLDGTAAPLAPGRLQTALSVAFEPPWSLAFGARLSVRVSPSLEFATQGLPAARYFPVLPNQFAPDAAGWFFESATRAGRDLMIDGVELEPGSDATDILLTFADRRTTLSGTVLNASGQPHPSAAVVAFPADVRSWIDRGLPPLASFSVAASQSGAFSMDVRPGEYFVAAIDDARLDDRRSRRKRPKPRSSEARTLAVACESYRFERREAMS